MIAERKHLRCDYHENKTKSIKEKKSESVICLIYHSLMLRDVTLLFSERRATCVSLAVVPERLGSGVTSVERLFPQLLFPIRVKEDHDFSC